MAQLQFQLCVTGMLLAQRYGELNQDYLNQAKLILDNYEGSDKPESLIKFVDFMLEASQLDFTATAEKLRAQDAVGLSLKNHSTILIDSNAVQISQFPIDLQSNIYEFKNTLNIYNQEVEMSNNILERTYDSTLSDINRERLSKGLNNKYANLQNICTKMTSKIQGILNYEL